MPQGSRMEDAIQAYEINDIDDIENIFGRVISGEEIHIENLKLNFLESIDFKFLVMKISIMVLCLQVWHRVSVNFKLRCTRFLL